MMSPPASERLRFRPAPLWALAVLVIVGGCSQPRASTPAGPNRFGEYSGSTPSGAPGSLVPPPTVSVTPPSLPTGTVARVPASIRGNCSVDVTTALESWVASVPDNSTLVFGKHACYLIDGTLTIEDRHRLLLDGNGATLKAHTTGKRNRAQLVLRGGSDLTVRDLVVRGANPEAGATLAAYHADLEAQHGFVVHGVTDVLLDHVQAYDLYGDFVNIGAQDKIPSRGVTVANSHFERSGRQGISVTAANGVLIEANVISGAARSLFDLEPYLLSQSVRNVRIVGNVTGPAVNFWLANKGAAADIGNIEVSGNRMAAPTGGLVFVAARRGAPRGPYLFDHNQLIADDRVHDEGSTGAFFFTRADNVTVRANTVQFPKGHHMPAVELRGSHHVVVQGNQFLDAGPTLIAGQGSSDYHAS